MSSTSTDTYMVNSGESNQVHNHETGGLREHAHDNETIRAPREPSIAAPMAPVNKEIENNNPVAPDSTHFAKYISGSGNDYVTGNSYMHEYPKYAANSDQAFAHQDVHPDDNNDHNPHPVDNACVMDYNDAQVPNKMGLVEEETVRQASSGQESGSHHAPDQTLTANEQFSDDRQLETDSLQPVDKPPDPDELNQNETKDKIATTAQKQDNPFDFVTVNFYQFKCKFCNASFDRRKSFKKHITNEHGILPYVCHLCGMGYDHKSDLKEHVKEHTAEKESIETADEPEKKPEHAQSDVLEDDATCKERDQQKETTGTSYSVTQINPEEHKLHLTKSLHLLAQVSHMRDTRERSTRKTTSTVSNSEKQAKTEEDKPVPNKRKRGRPRRLPGRSTATTNKRKERQPRKAKQTVRKPRKSKKQCVEEDEAFVKEGNEEKVTSKKKIEVTKGNYKLRPQTVEMDYSTQLDGKAETTPSFECRYCHLEFNTEGKKQRHERVHKEFACNTCGVKFGTFKDMKRHEDKHFPDEMKCHFCNELYKTKKELWAHEETHDKLITCRWCGASYDKRSELDSHERLHFISKTSNTIFECHFCQKICKSRKSWKSHLVSHSNIRSFECEICGKKYKQQGSFNLHMQRHNNTFYKFTCQFCGKKYGQKALLIIHERTHTNERPFKCTHCDLAYPSKNQLDHHMQRVMGVKHMCSFCGKQLNSRSSLEIHERIHTGTRPIKCEFCDMDFIEASSYKYHLRVIHTGERFECKYCGKQCKARGVLNAHMRVHTGERPFKCQYCNKAFRSGNVLRTHVQGIHMGVRHKCELCGREFAQTSALNTHKKLVHEGLKWKDIQLQRKINRQNRERRDRQLIENALGKGPQEESGETVEQAEPVKYMEPVNKTLEPPPVSNQVTTSIPALSDMERSMASSMMAPAPSIMATAPSMMVSPQAPPSSMMPLAARPIHEPDRSSVDVIFQPAISGTAMYHVL